MSNDIIVPDMSRDIVAQSDDLSRIVTKALLKIESIIDIVPETIDQENRMKLLSVQKDAATSIINAGLKADENRFRRENKDIITRLFDKIEKERKIVEGQVTRKS